MKKEEVEKIEKQFDKKLEKIVKILIILGYEMGKKQSETPYKYTCDTDKGKKYWKEIKQIIIDAGYVHKSQITIDEGEVDRILFNINRNYDWGHRDLYDGQFRRKIAQALKKADIWKIEEEKE